MVYKIQYDLQNAPSNLFYKLEKLGDFIYAYGEVYLHSNQTKQFIHSKIKSKGSQIVISETNTGSLYRLPNNIQEWIKVRLLAEEKSRYERENQEALKELNYLIDEVEKELVLQTQRKEVENATSQETTGDNG